MPIKNSRIHGLGSASFLIIFSLASLVNALNNGLARTPPMGWSSWNAFHNNIEAALITQTADKLVSTGLAAAGYKYLNIDDGWYNSPNASQFNSTKFPNGIKPVVDHAHGLGLKVGIYTKWDSRNNETRDANAWASWGIDYVKYDSWQQFSTDTAIWTTMRDAIKATGRPMVYSVHFQDRAKVIGNPTHMNMWRFTNDMIPYYNPETRPKGMEWGMTTLDVIAGMERVANITGPGYWADADMLMVEIGKQTMDEWKTQFAMWCLLPAPLLMASDIRTSPKSILDIYLNKDLIAVNQDTLGSKAWKVRGAGNQQVWARRLADSSVAAVLINSGATDTQLTVSWTELKVQSGKALVRDLWRNQDIGLNTGSYSVVVPTHGTAMIKVTPERLISVGSRRTVVKTEFNAQLINGILECTLPLSVTAPILANINVYEASGREIGSVKRRLEPRIKNSVALNSLVRKPGAYLLSIQTDQADLNFIKKMRYNISQAK